MELSPCPLRCLIQAHCLFFGAGAACEAAAAPARGRNGSIDEVLQHIHFGMLRFIGMDVLPPFIAYGAARVTPERRAQYLDEYRARMLTLETTAPIQFHR